MPEVFLRHAPKARTLSRCLHHKHWKYNTRAHAEGITVIGEAVRRVAPEQAEFLIEISATAPTASQALRDNQAKTVQVTQAVSALGVQPADIQTISLNVMSLDPPVMPALPARCRRSGRRKDSWLDQTKHTLRVGVREAARVGEIVDTAARAGAGAVSPFCFKAPDEGNARKRPRSGGEDARAKAEALAGAAGRKIGEAISISEDIVASNGTFAVLRSAFPLAFGAGAPRVAGELEYYARVSRQLCLSVRRFSLDMRLTGALLGIRQTRLVAACPFCSDHGCLGIGTTHARRGFL